MLFNILGTRNVSWSGGDCPGDWRACRGICSAAKLRRTYIHTCKFSKHAKAIKIFKRHTNPHELHAVNRELDIPQKD